MLRKPILDKTLILENKEFVASLLYTFPSGKAQKYERQGAQEFVSYPYEDVTLIGFHEVNLEFSLEIITLYKRFCAIWQSYQFLVGR